MQQVREWFQRSGAFLSGVAVEFRKTTWPRRRELTESTVAVIVFIALLAFFVTVSDRVILALLRLITGAG